ncbi:MAG: type II toxin-antitoxin system VapC family toxin, partial [Actinomycetota bacterium]
DSQLMVTGLLDNLGINTVEFSDAHWRSAAGAYWFYGRGRHPAGLNFGDCLTYAVASLADEPLLFVGDDFTHTDLTPTPLSAI